MSSTDEVHDLFREILKNAKAGNEISGLEQFLAYFQSLTGILPLAQVFLTLHTDIDVLDFEEVLHFAAHL
jgi:hypothetical protein